MFLCPSLPSSVIRGKKTCLCGSVYDTISAVKLLEKNPRVWWDREHFSRSLLEFWQRTLLICQSKTSRNGKDIKISMRYSWQSLQLVSTTWSKESIWDEQGNMTQTTSGNNLEMKEYMFYHEREEKMIWNMITSRKRKRTTTKIFSQSLITKNGFGDFAVLFFSRRTK